MKRLFAICYLLINAYIGYGQKDTFEVYFPFNDPKITKEAADHIDQLVFKDTLIHGDKLVILGYADYVGGHGHNDTLSRQRAANVRDYLVKMGFDTKEITLCVGKGKIDRTGITDKNGYAPDRKVQIVIDRVKGKPAAPPPHPAKIDISHLKVNETFALKNIFFEPGSPVLLRTSYPELKILLAFLRENPTVKISIEGHVCCLGPKEGIDDPYGTGYLSQFRAAAIRKYLIDSSINKDRLKAVGLGNLNPAVKEEITEEDRIKNRRVEIRILSK